MVTSNLAARVMTTSPSSWSAKVAARGTDGDDQRRADLVDQLGEQVGDRQGGFAFFGLDAVLVHVQFALEAHDLAFADGGGVVAAEPADGAGGRERADVGEVLLELAVVAVPALTGVDAGGEHVG